MGKITFRADDDLVAELEAFDASKSEVMREALRTHLDTRAHEEPSRASSPQEHVEPSDDTPSRARTPPSIDDLVREIVDDCLERRFAHPRATETQDVNVTIALEGVDAAHAHSSGRTTERERKTVDEDPGEEADTQCSQCGEGVDASHVYCPNCGEKASRQAFCECGDEIRSDWAFCPGCGRRTPAADVLDSR